MQSRCDSAAGLTSLGPLKEKEISYDFIHDAHQHHAQQCQQQQQDAHHSHQRFCLQPAEIYEHIVEGGQGKHQNSWLKEIILGIMAGAFICFGFATCMIAAGQISKEDRHDNPGMFNLLFGAYGFPVGLSMCVINGASLFTSNIAYMTAAFMERKSTAFQSLRVVWLSYFSNLVGCLFLVHLMVTGDVFLHREAFTIELAVKKTSYSFLATMTKGILCNWLVCMAVWQGNAAQDITGKLLGIWFPISAFVTSGYEHSVANMFVIPLAMRLGAPITLQTFLIKNLIPATIGNIIGGAIFVAMAMGLSFGSWEKTINAAGARLYNRTGAPKSGLSVFGAANAPKDDSDAHSSGGVSNSSSDGNLVARAVVQAHLAVAQKEAKCPKSTMPHPTA